MSGNEKHNFVGNPDSESQEQIDNQETTNIFYNDIRLYVSAQKKEMISLSVYNEQGKLVRYKEVEGHEGDSFIQLENTAQLSSGVYFLQMNRSGEKTMRKIIKQ